MEEKDRKKFDAQLMADESDIAGWALEEMPDGMTIGDVPDWWYEDSNETINLKNAKVQ